MFNSDIEDMLVYSREEVDVVTFDTSTGEGQAVGRVRQEDCEFQASWAMEGDPASTNNHKRQALEIYESSFLFLISPLIFSAYLLLFE